MTEEAEPDTRGNVANRPIAGIIWILAAVALFVFVDLLVKLAAREVSTTEILFFRMVFGMVPLVPALIIEAGKLDFLPLLKTKRLAMHMFRSVIGILFLTLYFVSVILLPLADAYAVSFATPLWVAALSVPLLGEKVGLRRWVAMGMGLVGILIILRPGGGALSLGGLAGLGATFFLALSMIMIRTMSRTESSSAIVFYYTLAGIVVTTGFLLAGLSSPPLAALWDGFFAWTTPNSSSLWIMLIAQGVIGGIGQIFITMAFRTAPAVIVSPFTYSSILWGLAYGIMLFGDVPTALTLIGAAIVVGSGVYVLIRETQVKRQEMKAATGGAD